MICKICRKEIASKGLGSHLMSHNINAKDYYDLYLKQLNEGICLVCGKETPFLKISKGYQNHCSIKCSQLNTETRARIYDTNEKRYGVQNFFQNKNIQSKAEHNAHTETAIQKRKETSRLHFGVDNPFQSEEVKNKIRAACLKTYGCEYSLQSQEVRNKGKQTMLDKYGVEHALQNKEIKQKQECTEASRWIELAKENHWLLVQSILKEYSSGWYQSPLGKEITFNIRQQDFIKSKDLEKIKLYNECDSSYIEYKVYYWLLQHYNKTIELHNRQLIKPYEIDIYLPELNIGFECNGYYHRNNCYTNRDQDSYHNKKSELCKSAGIQLIHIFEEMLPNLDDMLNYYIYDINNCSICKICGKQFKAANHIKKMHNITSKEYYDLYIKTDDECKCKICGKSTMFTGLKTGYKLYCSVKCAQNDSKVRDKVLTTTKANLKTKFGVENVQQIPEVREKTIKTCLERFGTEYAISSNEIKAKIREIQMSKNTEYDGLTKTDIILNQFGTGWYQKRDKIGIDIVMKGRYSYIKTSDIQKIEEYLTSELRKSAKETELFDFINSIYQGEILRNNKNVIGPKELDIYLPDIKLAIEYNGNYWHSIERGTSIDYHLNKSILCRNLGIRLIHIYEFEDFEQQKQLLRDLILGKDNYPLEDFNKNNLIITVPKPEIIYSDKLTVYGAGKLY